MTTEDQDEKLRDVESMLLSLIRGDFSRRVVLGDGDTVIDAISEGLNLVAAELGALLEESAAAEAAATQRADEVMQAYEKLQSTLVQTEKLTALGELAAGVAHDLREPLNSIKLIAQSMVLDAERGRYDIADVPGDGREIAEVVNRMAGLIDHLRIYTRKSEDKLSVDVDVNASVGRAINMLEQQLMVQDIKVEKCLSDGLAPARGDPNGLEQIFVNLMTNARDALLLRRERDERFHARIGVRSFVLNAKELCVEVEDNAGGVPSEIRDQIFDPFFTTKSSGRGTGLGLSIVQRIMGEYGGRLELEVQDGEGSTFRAILPLQPVLQQS